jgi:hypothetical protein
MRNLILPAVVGFALLSSLPAHSQPLDKTALQETLVKLEKQSWEAWKNHDGKFFEGFLADEHIDVGGGGTTNKATTVSGVNSPACTVKTYAVDHFELTVLDTNAAILTYHAAQDTTCGGHPVPSPTWVSSVYIKHGDRWQNALFQQSKAAK